MHPIDHIDLHRQNGEMTYSSLTSSTSNVLKLHNSFNNTLAELKMEKTSSLVEDVRIKSLEYLGIKLGLDPKNVDATQEIFKKKDEEI